MFENDLISTERDARRLVTRSDAISLAILSIRDFKIAAGRRDLTQ